MSAIILSRNSLIEVILRWSRTRRPSRPSRDTLDRLIPRGLLQLRRSRSVQRLLRCTYSTRPWHLDLARNLSLSSHTFDLPPPVTAMSEATEEIPSVHL